MERGDACSREELRERMRTECNEMEDMSLTGSQAYRMFHVDPQFGGRVPGFTTAVRNAGGLDLPAAFRTS